MPGFDRGMIVFVNASTFSDRLASMVPPPRTCAKATERPGAPDGPGGPGGPCAFQDRAVSCLRHLPASVTTLSCPFVSFRQATITVAGLLVTAAVAWAVAAATATSSTAPSDSGVPR